MKRLLVLLALAIPVVSFAQSGDGWGAPPDNSAAWGSRTDDLNPIAPRNVHKLDRSFLVGFLDKRALTCCLDIQSSSEQSPR